jgi:hypothetical protein
LTGQVETDWEDPLSRVREISGSGALDLGSGPLALPNYVRFDLGVEHELMRNGSKERLQIAINVDNVLDRDNVATWIRSAPTGTDASVPMIPLSARVSLHWTY